MKGYPTSLKEDRKLLTSRELGYNLTNIITLRKGEKEILLFYQQMGRKLVRYLANPAKTADLRIYDTYLKSI